LIKSFLREKKGQLNQFTCWQQRHFRQLFNTKHKT